MNLTLLFFLGIMNDREPHLESFVLSRNPNVFNLSKSFFLIDLCSSKELHSAFNCGVVPHPLTLSQQDQSSIHLVFHKKNSCI